LSFISSLVYWNLVLFRPVFWQQVMTQPFTGLLVDYKPDGFDELGKGVFEQIVVFLVYCFFGGCEKEMRK